MPLTALTEEEREIVLRCLRAAASGPFFEDDEFFTLFGVSRSELRAVIGAWPNVDESEEAVHLSINNSLVNLAGYVHGFDLHKHVEANANELLRILLRWQAT